MSDGLYMQVGSRYMSVAPGTVLGIGGPRGGGRSRLLRAIAGAQHLDDGRFLLDGAPVQRRDVGLVTQERTLIGSLTAAENVMSAVLARRGAAPDVASRITELLADLRLPEASWNNLAEQLSGGQQQRVAIARALVWSPPLLCLDEPTSELDPATSDTVWGLFRSAAERGAIVVVVPSTEREQRYCDLVVTPMSDLTNHETRGLTQDYEFAEAWDFPGDRLSLPKRDFSPRAPRSFQSAKEAASTCWPLL